MIEETKRKIHFTAFDIKKGRSKDTSAVPTMAIYQGSLRFNKSVIDELSLDGKFVRFYYDPTKQIIGFQVKHEIAQTQMRTWKMARQNKTSGLWSVSIKKLLRELGEETESKNYYSMPVHKYVEQSEMMNRGEVYYYVRLAEAGDLPRKKSERLMLD